jgi:hypothetical protein
MRRVLARALELQAQNDGSLTTAQVRDIASELSIPEFAVDQALSEYRAAPAASRLRPARPLMISMAVVGGAFVLLTILSVITRL